MAVFLKNPFIDWRMEDGDAAFHLQTISTCRKGMRDLKIYI